MIKKLLFSIFLFFLFSCSNIDFVLKENDMVNPYKNKTTIVFDGTKEKKFAQEVTLFFGNKKNAEFLLITSFSEKKENRLVKKNQVAEKIDYELTINYEMFYKNTDCKIYNKKIVTKFSFVPKSFGYNFGTDRSLEKLYKRSLKKNIKKLINFAPVRDLSICRK